MTHSKNWSTRRNPEQFVVEHVHGSRWQAAVGRGCGGVLGHRLQDHGGFERVVGVHRQRIHCVRDRCFNAERLGEYERRDGASDADATNHGGIRGCDVVEAADRSAVTPSLLDLGRIPVRG